MVNPVTAESRLERDVFLHRAYIALKKHDLTVEEIKDDPSVPVPLRAVRELALFYARPESAGDRIERVKALFQEGGNPDDTHTNIVLATMYMEQGSFKDALRHLRGSALEQCVRHVKARPCRRRAPCTHR